MLEIACYILTVTSASFVLLLKVLRAGSLESYSRLSGQYWWPFLTPGSSSPYVQEPTTGLFFEPDKCSHTSFKIRGYLTYHFLRSIWHVWVKREMLTGFWIRKLKEKDGLEESGVVETIMLKCISKKYGRGVDSACNRNEY